ncbi:MAG: DUF433 domain-containing protein [Proteobacteria bacterium]|nr:DUF433 domain-containing protein [Pseudomonadota bacterium]
MTVISSAIQIQYVLFAAVPCFVGTRIPVKSLFDFLLRGDSLHEYLEQYPSVPRALAVKVIQDSSRALLSSASARAAA